MAEEKAATKCPCCGQEATVEYRAGKWEGEKPKVIISHKKWPGRGQG